MKTISMENVLHCLTNFNYWWQLGITFKGKLPSVRRTAFYEVSRRMEDNQVVFLHGPHQTGKTTLMLQIIQTLISSGVAPERIIYIPLDRPIFRFFSPREILRVYHDNLYAKHDTFHFFDDSQCYPGWEAWEKAICGNGRGKLARIVTAGTLMPPEESPQRDYPVARVYMPSMSFYEYCQILAPDELPQLPAKLPPAQLMRISRQEQTSLLMRLSPLRKHFARYIQVGGFPGLQTAEQSIYQLHNSVKKTLYVDIACARNVRNIDDMERAFLFLCFQNPDVASFENISRALSGISRKTVEKYIHLLEEAGLIHISMPVPLGNQQMLKVQPKIYISDFAVKNAVRTQGRLQFDREGLNGSIEASAFQQLKVLYAGTDIRIGYSKHTARRKQIDIVVDKPRKQTFIDIRYLDDWRPSRSDPSMIFAAQARQVFLLTKREHDFGPLADGPENLYRIPAHAFLYLLGHYNKYIIDNDLPASPDFSL